MDHKRPTKAIKAFALSLFGRVDSFSDLFYAVNSYLIYFFLNAWGFARSGCSRLELTRT